MSKKSKFLFGERKKLAYKAFGAAKARPQDAWKNFLLHRRRINFGQQPLTTHPNSERVLIWTPGPDMLKVSREESCEVTSVKFVDTPALFHEMCADLNYCNQLIMDTEAHDEHSYTGMISLIQIASNSHVYLIDPFPILNLVKTELKVVLERENVLVIMHGCDNDILWLKRDFNIHLMGVMDTQNFHQAMHRGNKQSFENLVSFYAPKIASTGNQTQKQIAQVADWRIRPLPYELIKYAAEDVSKLKVVWAAMKGQDQTGEYILQAIATTKKVVLGTGGMKNYGSPGKELLSLRKKTKLTEQQKEKFSVLWEWRQFHAKGVDENPRTLLPSTTMVSLAKRSVLDEKCLMSIITPFPCTLEKSKSTILRLMREGRLFLEKIKSIQCNNCLRTGHAAFACWENFSWANTKRFYDNHPKLKSAQNKRRHQNKKKNKQSKDLAVNHR